MTDQEANPVLKHKINSGTISVWIPLIHESLPQSMDVDFEVLNVFDNQGLQLHHQLRVVVHLDLKLVLELFLVGK